MVDTSAATQWYVGIDVAADTFAAAWRTAAGTPAPPFTGEQTPVGFVALQRRLAASGVAVLAHYPSIPRRQRTCAGSYIGSGSGRR